MSDPPSVLFIDNFDSFSFNLVDEFRKRGCTVHVWRNDIPAETAVSLALALPPPALLVLSPGPGRPEQAGCCVDAVRLVAGRMPIFGVCLGLQAIVAAFDGSVTFAGEVVHGKAAQVEHDGRGIFAGLDSPLLAGRYHSLAATRLPDELRVVARCRDVIMAIEHVRQPVVGVQFHPESILTPWGGELLARVIRWAIERDDRATASPGAPGE